MIISELLFTFVAVSRRKRLRLTILWEKYCEKRHASFLFLRTYKIFKSYAGVDVGGSDGVSHGLLLLHLYLGFSYDLQVKSVAYSSGFVLRIPYLYVSYDILKTRYDWR